MGKATNFKLRKRLRQQAKTERPWVGLVGDAAGNIEVPGRPNLWYVRPKGSNLPVIVYGGSAPRVANTEVLVGPDPFWLNRKRILGVYAHEGSTTSELQTVGPHAPSHGEAGSDPVWITTKQITNGLVYPSTGMTVNVHAGWAVLDGQPVKFAAASIDLSGSVPVAGARYSLIRLDGDGAIDVQDGTAVDLLTDLDNDAVPELADGYLALAVVRLYAGQTSLSRVTSSPDVFDLRFLSYGGGSGAGASDFVDLGDVPASYSGYEGYQVVVNEAGDGLEFIPRTYWEPVTDGDEDAPELLFEDGDVVMEEVEL